MYWTLLIENLFPKRTIDLRENWNTKELSFKVKDKYALSFDSPQMKELLKQLQTNKFSVCINRYENPQYQRCCPCIEIIFHEVKFPTRPKLPGGLK